MEQTKLRPRRSNDNGLVEAKNGAVIRKHIGYGHIESEHAGAIQEFCERSFNPYLNLHGPCAVPEAITDAKRKQRRINRRYATPLEFLGQLPDVKRHLKEGQTLAALEERASEMSDTEAARRRRHDKHILFAAIRQKRTARTAQGGPPWKEAMVRIPLRRGAGTARRIGQDNKIPVPAIRRKQTA